ncbi:uncharacterized protein EV420DRAFT_1527710 [Desarmillaria tabescens]|uniref:F-box domain-containing protein n=1 Tax=Armillaria tabescens TaxID=1929756 RepID=A0AA39TS01_ARMTA|nr:uncharacterized protein EV420DRAFT_1527710 [Desarmillaria tabescens]KAK0461864.1 hypothetical protein EV420DRAFT_1527710 [Desarmillaria tabescens]
MKPSGSDAEMFSYGCREEQPSHSHVTLPLNSRKRYSDIISPNREREIELEELIHSLQKYLQQNCNEIRYHRDALKRLEQRRQRLQALLDQNSAFFSPIRAMPTEILSLIFDCFCSNIGFNDRARPLVLASVCYRWRSIAVSYPSIWTRINTARHSPHADERTRNFVQLYLDRSQDMPIRIHVSDFPLGAPDNTLLSMLAAHSHRWFRATFSLTTEGYYVLFRALEGQSLTRLRKFNLYGPSLDGVPDSIQCNALMMACKLDILTVQQPIEHPENLGLPFGRIKQLNLIDHDNPSSILRCIAQTMNLRHLRITATSNCQSRGPLPTPVVAAKVLYLSLRMGNFDGDLFEKALLILSTPTLQHLKVALPLPEECPISCSPKLNGIFSVKPISELIVRSACRLRSLRVENINIDEDELIQLLENAPTITTLVLYELYPGVNIPSPCVLTPRRWITDKLLRRLTITPNVPVILPRLKHLHILISCMIRELDEVCLLRMVKSRTSLNLPKGERLKKLYFASKKSTKSYSWLHKLPKHLYSDFASNIETM